MGQNGQSIQINYGLFLVIIQKLHRKHIFVGKEANHPSDLRQKRVNAEGNGREKDGKEFGVRRETDKPTGGRK